jgi:hypothetical protein
VERRTSETPEDAAGAARPRRRALYYRDAGHAHPNYQALQYVGIRGFVPDWDANLDAPVSREEAECWIERADLPAPVAYTPDSHGAARSSKRCTNAWRTPRGAGDDGPPIPR